MEISSYSQTDSLSFPLPLYHSVRIGEAAAKDGSRFFLYAGLTKERVAELKRLSFNETDAELQHYTSDRARFGTGSYEEWYAKGRTPFALVAAETDELAALVLLGQKLIDSRPDKNYHTISYRCYPHFRGRGLMKKFAVYAIEVYTKRMPEIKLWARILTENAASQGLAKHLGFAIDEALSDRKNHQLIMIRQ